MAEERVNRIARVAIVAIVAVAAINTAFYFLSLWYYADKAKAAQMPIDTVALDNVRIAFAFFALAVAGAAVLASLSPRVIGHISAAVLGVANVIAALVSFGAGLTPVLGFALLLGGGTMVALAYFSYFKHSRAAWAFLAALLFVFGLCLLFGAPKVRSLVGIGLW